MVCAEVLFYVCHPYFPFVSTGPRLGPTYLVQGQWQTAMWSNILVLTGLTLSIAVNALVTELIVFRIFKVFQEVLSSVADEQILGTTGGSKLRCVIFTLTESGMTLFSIQSTQFLVSIVDVLTGTMLPFLPLSL